MASVQETKFNKPRVEGENNEAVEVAASLTPEGVKHAGEDLVSEVKTSGHARLEKAARGLPAEEQDSVDQARTELKKLDEEADEALEILDAEIIEEGDEEEPPPIPEIDELPPPLPKEALKQATQRSTEETATAQVEGSRRLDERKEAEAKIQAALVDLSEKVKPSEIPEEIQKSDVKIALFELMAQLYDFSRDFVGYEKVDEEALQALNSSLQNIIRIRPGTENFVSQAFEDVFQEFGDFFENNLVHEYIEKERKAGRVVSVETATQAVYHRTPEEVEKLKERNRVATAELVNSLATKESLSLEDIESLHQANNRGIVPKSASRLRSRPGESVRFFKRFGTLPGQVQAAMEDVVDRANQLIQKKQRGEIGKIAYAIAAAELHNDMLDIHPFKDRNGSTSILFLETLMGHQGYKAEAVREKKYYTQLFKVLGGNLLALGVVGLQQVIIAQKYGYYMSPEIMADPEMKAFYDDFASKYKERSEEENKVKRVEYKAALAAYKKAHPGKIQKALSAVGSFFSRKKENK